MSWSFPRYFFEPQGGTMTAIPHRVEWLDHGVVVATDDFFDEWMARDWIRQQDHLGPDALDDGTCWLVPAWDEGER